MTLAHTPSPLVHTKAQGNRSALASTPSPFTDITPTTAPPGAAVSQLKMTGNEQNMHTWCFLSFFCLDFLFWYLLNSRKTGEILQEDSKQPENYLISKRNDSF